MHPFDCFVGIDWSGDKRASQKGIKVAIARPGRAAPELASPSHGARWSRSKVANWIIELVGNQRVLVGLDFAFGFPVLHYLVRDLSLSWDYVEKLCAPDGNFYGGRFFRTPGTDHAHLVNSAWLPRCQYSAYCLRSTEREAQNTRGATPQSIFNAIGAAQVGPSSISGMRVLRYLRESLGSRILIWPFDEVSDTQSAIVEVFPRYFALSKGLSPKMSDHSALNDVLTAFDSDPVEFSPSSEDEGDALIAAAALRCLSKDPTRFALPSAEIREEGWIFGVPLAPPVALGLTDEQIAEIELRLSDDQPIASPDDVLKMFERLTK